MSRTGDIVVAKELNATRPFLQQLHPLQPTFMKDTRSFAFAFAIAFLSLLPRAAEAGKDTHPVGEKVPLNLSHPSVNVTPNAVTISWSTNKESDSSLAVAELPLPFGGDVVIVLDSTPTTKHEMTMPYLIPGRTYEYEVISSDPYGYTVRTRGVFTTPASL